ncbi:acyl-CoA dehydrogenase family protein [Microbacterium sp. p3-SID336]|uniref:acyl-CoA dehydrogenase family protein n=1 Tax=Microbacterium sp. p3-SID336 TaxID=2916212 RepID=UPI0021A85E5E|nr:acyl-CoA dehydrogenase family protein [Microbacterium sp. p3-SID336]MCT1479919.1 acyl-CoA dehydrogenase family protein [Microbacterium sp. p3-SID336]
MERDIFDHDHEAFREASLEFLAREVTPHYATWETEGIVPRELFTGLGELGLFAAVPEEFGGSGVEDLRFSAVLAEEAAEAGVFPALTGATLQSDVVLPYLLRLASAEQQQRWLPAIAEGRTILAIAMTEPGTGSDLAGIRTRAVREGDHYVVNGAKTFITNGINADLVLVVVRTGDDPHRGLSLLAVERGTPGFERGRRLEKLGMHVQDTAELSFSDAIVPAANLVGEEGGGFFALTSNLPTERLSIAIAAVAQARTALRWTADHVRARKAFGVPIGSFQTTRHRLADLDTEIDITRHYVDRCLAELVAGRLSPVDAAKAKLWATELLGRTTDACVQLHGGYGYMTEYPIARLYADARVSRIYGGTSEIMREIIGRSLRLD